jgi:diguanylate cyclase (GGDEF)-like protein/putative nucleotidyltransferase with HDIG domain
MVLWEARRGVATLDSLFLHEVHQRVFGERRLPRPVLLILVFGVLLVLVGITATAQAVMVSAYASASTLTAVVDSDVATIRGFVHQGLDGLDTKSPDPATADRVNGYLDTLLAKGTIAHAEIRQLDGRVIAASGIGTVGIARTITPDFAAAAAGTPSVVVVSSAEAEASGASLPPTVLREYLPLRQGNATLLVIGVWRDASPILTTLDGLRRDVVIVILTAAVIAAAVLFLVFRTAQNRINRQTVALVNATLLDGLTESLNHGALVGHLAEEIELARAAGTPLGVALVDVDNFRMLNDTHGHGAGDDVLLLVAAAVREHLGDGMVMGRYGPDEFLVVGRHESITKLEVIAQQTRATLADVNLQFESTERLPLTVSVGICTFPDHGTSVTELLSTVAATLREAKASGGDAVRLAGRDDADRQPGVSNFDVLQGLVLAVDTKDRYTKRHSEDVSRYAVFLAEQLGLDAATIETIRTAGLLHDVGKIGVPDAILRKPGRLTADEFEVLKQHVALGDMIVRDLPEIDAVRAAVRHHHERWDGRGYLDALAGEDIPLIARILAVGDGFSAMTTTRPYRKALDVREALARLGDAAGTQLDESLVKAFVRGIESVPTAPLPGSDVPPATLWRPRRRVA